jgi:hypothetical protein
MLLSHESKSVQHQDFQQPGSGWIYAECDTERDFGNVIFSCNFVICIVKYTHTCALGMRFNLSCDKCGGIDWIWSTFATTLITYHTSYIAHTLGVHKFEQKQDVVK